MGTEGSAGTMLWVPLVETAASDGEVISDCQSDALIISIIQSVNINVLFGV